MADIVALKIHPSIGVMRVGNSEDVFGYYFGPERRWEAPTTSTEAYLDHACRVKRQAARFYIFAHFDDGTTANLTSSDGGDTRDVHIEWSVSLANKKAIWPIYPPSNDRMAVRNITVLDRKSIVFASGPTTVGQRGQTRELRDPRGFKLGNMRMDFAGRLLVLGGKGKAGACSKPGSEIDMEGTDVGLNHGYNAEGWFDDVSDGWVAATVTFRGMTIQAEPAWVICAPPRYAPGIQSPTTLFDALLQSAKNQNVLDVERSPYYSETPSFTQDIYPILWRASQVYWVMGLPKASGDNPHLEIIKEVLNNPASDVRREVFGRLQDPADRPWAIGLRPPPRNMPILEPGPGLPPFGRGTGLSRSAQLTFLQYEHMRKWALTNDWINDWKGFPKAENEVTPHGLDRSALEDCIGAAMFPGIEAGEVLRDQVQWKEPLRIDQFNTPSTDPLTQVNLNHGDFARDGMIEPGDITGQMALPWHGDFRDCWEGWWPSERPSSVFLRNQVLPASWPEDFGVGTSLDMVRSWDTLPIVLRDGEAYVEPDARYYATHDCPTPIGGGQVAKDISSEKWMEKPLVEIQLPGPPLFASNASLRASATARPFIRAAERPAVGALAPGGGRRLPSQLAPEPVAAPGANAGMQGPAPSASPQPTAVTPVGAGGRLGTSEDEP